MKRLLIIGCGDVARRALPVLKSRYSRVFALARSESSARMLRAMGVVPIRGDLDRPDSLRLLAGLADDVLHSAPPPGEGLVDTRTRDLIAALSCAQNLPQRLVYLSTTGVYGDCSGEAVPETRPIRPSSPRAVRRADAEDRLRCWGRRSRVTVSVLRVPGIYAADRLPLARLRQGTPAICAEEDSFSNHIHADDLAHIVVRALVAGRPCRIFNTGDDSAMRMGDYFDLVADQFGLTRPRRISRTQAEAEISAPLLSFMRESRQLTNGRLKRELRIGLRYPTVHAGVAEAARVAGIVPRAVA
ncbi:MAG: NAD-dependent epimerase/dehydratase family protein [Betaproteobacteria bacterium]|jgi:nucleoside-diphosphate-sugar epimerase|nr:NAD-dependent epimerase/dehydratase family protein [Rhodocyclaceae bacterium]MCE2978696.1 NAD-dependent epimerase/dehydratase family protein [Betaproteobacteria bacterium]